MVITGRNWRRLRPRGLPASTAWCDPSICPGASSCCDPCICCIRRARSALGTTSRKARAEEEVWRAEVFCLMPPSIGEATVLRLDQVSKNRERNCRNNWFVELVVACMLYIFFLYASSSTSSTISAVPRPSPAFGYPTYPKIYWLHVTDENGSSQRRRHMDETAPITSDCSTTLCQGELKKDLGSQMFFAHQKS